MRLKLYGTPQILDRADPAVDPRNGGDVQFQTVQRLEHPECRA
ncbi:MAG: hypothetical protein WD825_14220 [Gemmatimonadaceae bacterium]